MIEHDDGFKLAEIDLKLRGAGDRFGTRQSGELEFEFASLSDHALIAQARDAAEKLLEESDELKMYTPLIERLSEYCGEAHFA